VLFVDEACESERWDHVLEDEVGGSDEDASPLTHEGRRNFRSGIGINGVSMVLVLVIDDSAEILA
jgi:hypothetical protein